MKLHASITIVFILLSSYVFAQPNQVQAKVKEVENNLITYVPVKGFGSWNILDRMKYYKVPGVSIAVIKDFKIDWAKGYGLADTLKNIPVTTETMFSAGSISKFVAAVTALQLVQNGKLALDSPINNYLTSWKIPDNDFTRKKPISLRMLLSHTGGTTQSSYFGFIPDKNPLPTIVEILSGAPIAESRPVMVNSEPAIAFRYSGGGTMIAQMAMMDVSNQDFATLTQQTILEPLGMKNATFQQPLPGKYLSQASWGYSSAPWYKGMPYVYPQQAAAGLYATPTDLAKFIIDVQKSYQGKGKILQKNIAQQMLTPQVFVSDGGYKEEMGIGPFLLQRIDNKEPKGMYFEFTGVNAGFVAYVIGNLTEGYGAVIMLNTGDDFNGLGKEIRRAIAKSYNWYAFLPEEVQPISLSDEVLDKYVGRYRRGADEVVYLRKEKNYLIENINEGADISCFPVTKDTIVFSDFNIKGGFKTDEAGQVISLQSVWQDKPMPKMKVDEFSPGELLKARKYVAAKEGYRQMNMNEYQITYLVYELLNKKPAQSDAAKALLELAVEQHPNSSIVYSRQGDYYLKIKDKLNAIKSYQKALVLDPNDEQTKATLKQLEE